MRPAPFEPTPRSSSEGQHKPITRKTLTPRSPYRAHTKTMTYLTYPMNVFDEETELCGQTTAALLFIVATIGLTLDQVRADMAASVHGRKDDNFPGARG